MQEVKKETLALSRYFLSLPHPAKTTIALFLVSFIFGAFFAAAKGWDGIFTDLFAGGLTGIVLLALPALLSSLLLYLLRRKAIFRRAIFLGLVTSAIYGVFYLASFALSSVWSQAGSLIFIGYGLAFVFWFFLLYLAFDFRRSAFAFATLQLVLFSAAFLSAEGFGRQSDAGAMFVRVYLAAFVFLAALYVFFYFLSAPMKKNLKVSSMDAISMFLSQWLYGEKDLEEVFSEIGEDAETLVWVGRFASKGIDTLFVVPYIHYGPFGNLGGSEFTWLISEKLSDGGRNNVFVFHGTATHDFNPVSSDEIDHVVGACRRVLSRLSPKRASFSYSACRVGSMQAKAFRINDSAFLSYTRAPMTTEDVSLGLGLALLEKAARHCRCAAVVDEHNSETGDISSVEVGNPIGFEMLDATEKLLSQDAKLSPFKFGSSTGSVRLENVGKNGLKLALFAQGKKMRAILLCDSNGILPEFRIELMAHLSSLGKEKGFACIGEVMTTDTHQINTVKGVLNPLGSEGRGDVMLALRGMFAQATGRLSETKFDCGQQRFAIKVFGSGQSTEIASTINAVVSVLRLGLPIILVGSCLVLIWLLGRIR